MVERANRGILDFGFRIGDLKGGFRFQFKVGENKPQINADERGDRSKRVYVGVSLAGVLNTHPF